MTTSTERMARATREIAGAQHDAYRALTENLAVAQRRSMGLAADGLEFAKRGEDNARAAREWFASTAELLRLQRRNVEFFGDWTSEALEALREQTGHNVRAAETLARGLSKQQESLWALTEAWRGTYRDFFSPFDVYTREGSRNVRRTVQTGLETTERAEEVLRQTGRLQGLSAEQFERMLRAQAAAGAEPRRSGLLGAAPRTRQGAPVGRS